MRARDLRSHQVDVVVEGDRQQHIGVADARFALNIDVDAVALNELDALQLRSAAEAAGFFVDDGDLVASLDERCNCSETNPAISNDDYLHLVVLEYLTGQLMTS